MVDVENQYNSLKIYNIISYMPCVDLGCLTLFIFLLPLILSCHIDSAIRDRVEVFSRADIRARRHTLFIKNTSIGLQRPNKVRWKVPLINGHMSIERCECRWYVLYWINLHTVLRTKLDVNPHCYISVHTTTWLAYRKAFK